MPNFYTHLLFGRAVKDRTPPTLRRILTEEWDSFCCGNFGPDLLYFYYLGGKQAPALRQAGLRIHHGSGADAMERFRRPIQKGMPFAASFSAGYLLHYVLDSRLHPFVHEVTDGGNITHFALEGEFDRYLLLRDGTAYPDAIPEKEMPQRFYETAARMTPALTAEDYHMALKRFRMVSCRMGGMAGTPVRHLVNAASFAPPIRAVRGAVLGKEPKGDALPYLDQMKRLFQEAVPAGEEALLRFFEEVEQDLPLTGLDLDYSGNEVEKLGIH